MMKFLGKIQPSQATETKALSQDNTTRKSRDDYWETFWLKLIEKKPVRLVNASTPAQITRRFEIFFGFPSRRLIMTNVREMHNDDELQRIMN